MRAALLAPSFTEPEAVLNAAGVAIDHVVLPPPFTLAGAEIPAAADLVVVGNPTNPTGVLHPRESVLALRRPGRIVVVDEAFADAVGDEQQSLAGLTLPDVLVLRSLTKTWSLAGLRVATPSAHPGAGQAGGPQAALAAGHTATGGDRRLLHAGRRRCGSSRGPTDRRAACRHGGGAERSGPRRGRRPGTFLSCLPFQTRH